MEEDRFTESVYKELHREKQFTKEQCELFVDALKDGIKKNDMFFKFFMPSNKDVQATRKQLRSIEKQLSILLKAHERLPFLRAVEEMASTNYEAQFGYRTSLAKVSTYIHLYIIWVHCFYGVSSKSGPKNRQALFICYIVKVIYVGSFGELPTLSQGDAIQESGDISEGTLYERICYIMGREYNVEIKWSTCKQARNADSLELLQLNLSSDDPERLNSLMKYAQNLFSQVTGS